MIVYILAECFCCATQPAAFFNNLGSLKSSCFEQNYKLQQATKIDSFIGPRMSLGANCWFSLLNYSTVLESLAKNDDCPGADFLGHWPPFTWPCHSLFSAAWYFVLEGGKTSTEFLTSSIFFLPFSRPNIQLTSSLDRLWSFPLIVQGRRLIIQFCINQKKNLDFRFTWHLSITRQPQQSIVDTFCC